MIFLFSLGEAKPLRVTTPVVRIIEGKLVSFVEVHARAFIHKVYLRYSFYLMIWLENSENYF